MPIIDRYLIKELLKTSLAILLVLLVLMLGNTLVKILADVTGGEIASQYIWPLLLVSLANYIVLFMGLSLYLGIILTYGRLYKDSEMAALVSFGLSPKDFFRPLLIVAVPVTLLGLLFSLYLLPWMANVQVWFTYVAGQPSVETNLREAEFNQVPGGVVFVGKIENDVLHRIFIYTLSEGQTSIQYAETGYVDESDSGYLLQLQNGTAYQHNAQGEVARIQYREYEVHLGKKIPYEIEQVMTAMPTSALMRSDHLAHIAEWQWRLSIPLGCLLLAILAFPLSHTSPRQGAYSKIGYAILLYIFYSNVLGLAKNLLVQGKVSPVMGLWWAHLPIVVLIVILLSRQYGWQITRLRRG